jgi:hypothetical protein
MAPEDRKALWGIIVGLAWGGLTMAGPLAFPNTAPWIWKVSFGVSAIVVVAGLTVLLYDFFLRPHLKGHRLDPFLATAIAASVVTVASLAIYVVRGAATGASSPAQSGQTQPVLTLLPPKDHYTFKWDPTKAMNFDIQREGSPLPPGHTANPTFILHNSSSVAAADVTVTWQAQISGIKELAKVGRLEKHDIKFPDDYTLDLIGSSPVPNFRYYLNSHFEQKIPFVARDADLFMPINIYPILGLFITANMPDELGGKTEALPLQIDVAWNVPDGGEPKHFHVKIRGINTKPSGLTAPPEVLGYLEFEIEKP